MFSARYERRLFLDDLVVGMEFRSSEHHLDAEQIIASKLLAFRKED